MTEAPMTAGSVAGVSSTPPAKAYAVRSGTVSDIAQAISREHPAVRRMRPEPDKVTGATPAGAGCAISNADAAPTERLKIDKSALALAEPTRIRDQAHLKFVASQPCLICGRNKAQAHHLRFAQPKAMGRKVSDEYTVPLCSMHHRLLHQTGNEIAWWEYQQIDPLMAAAAVAAEPAGLKWRNLIQLQVQDPAEQRHGDPP